MLLQTYLMWLYHVGKVIKLLVMPAHTIILQYLFDEYKISAVVVVIVVVILLL